MNSRLLKSILEKRKGRGTRISLEDKAKENSEIPGVKPDKEDDEDGLAPGLKLDKESGYEKSEGDEDGLMDEAEKILGRKPMSLTRDNDDDDDEDKYAMSEKDIDEDVFEQMRDDRVMERLENGKKPTKLWERVQAQMMKRKK